MSKVIIVTGPSGAGKSTTAKHLAEKSVGEWAIVSQDDIRALVKAGYRPADIEWTDATKRQWDVSVLIATDMIKRYFEAGINCVVDLFAPPSEFEKWKEHIKSVDYRLIVLLPDVETTVKRNSDRENIMKEEKIRENHSWFMQWESDVATIIDTSKQTLNDSIKQIRDLV